MPIIIGVTTPLASDVNTRQYQRGSISLGGNFQKRKRQMRKRYAKETADHNFEWFDLDSIPESFVHQYNHDRAMVIGLDYNAGLIFTSETQFFQKKANVNKNVKHYHQRTDTDTVSLSSSNTDESSVFADTDNAYSNNKTNKNNNEVTTRTSIKFEFDLFPWMKNNDGASIDEDEKEETLPEKEERFFLERIEELENEVKSSCIKSNGNGDDDNNDQTDRTPSPERTTVSSSSSSPPSMEKPQSSQPIEKKIRTSFYLNDQCMGDSLRQNEMTLSVLHHRNNMYNIDDDDDDDDDDFATETNYNNLNIFQRNNFFQSMKQ